MSLRPTYTCEADVVAGLERFATLEIAHIGGQVYATLEGVIRFSYRGALEKLLTLRSVLAVYLLHTFAVPRPKALLGDAALRVLHAHIDTALVAGGHANTPFQTFMLAASGAQSPTMQRIGQTIASHTGLARVDENGALLVRLRPSPNKNAAPPAGWDVLVRIGSRPLAARPWRVCLIDGALQATVAHVMAQLTRPAANDFCLNLGCGSGTLLIERAMLGPASWLVGCDVDARALECAARNVTSTKYPIALQDWDATALPLPDGSVDVLMADLPFGVRVGSHRANEVLYPAVLREATRVAKPGARFVLISAEVRLLQQAVTQAQIWKIVESLRVDLGGLRPQILLLERAMAG